MTEKKGPSNNDSYRVITPPDAKKESEITDRFDFGSAQIQGQGPHHKEQQDYCTVVFPLEGNWCAAVVADGASWAEHAAEASSLAGTSFTEKVRQWAESDREINPAIVKMVLQTINVELLAKSRARERKAFEIADAAGLKGSARDLAIGRIVDMPTTFEGMVFSNNKVITAHLGDSRIYVLRGGVLSKLTQDQTRAEQLRSKGQPVKERDENVLINHLGDEEVDISVNQYLVEQGDVWLAMSDGVFKVLDENKIKEILSQQKDAVSLANELIAAVQAKGAFDDASAVIVKVK